MKKGDKVFWFSSANGTCSRKEGEILHVLKAGEVPPKSMMCVRMFDLMPCKHESYIVRCKGPTEKSKPRDYHPRVSALKLVGEAAKDSFDIPPFRGCTHDDDDENNEG